MIGNNLAITTKNYAVAGGAVAYDADALAYFTANTAITSTADKNAINTFYLGLKSDGIYTKMKAMYLPIWGSAAACKWNLVNPLDTNAAFRLSFTTDWTYSSGGITPNGTSAYAQTYITPSVTLSTDNTHISHYSRTNSTIFSADIGCQQSGGNNSLVLFADTKYYYRINDFNNGNVTPSNTLGFHLGSRILSTQKKFYKNGSNTGLDNINSLGLPNQSILIGAYQGNGAIQFYSNRQLSFSSIGNGLTDTEATNFYNRVQTLMTYFGINV